MVYILAILWVLIWGSVGYFTGRAIRLHIERKYNEKMMAAYIQDTMHMRNFTDRIRPMTLDDDFKKFFKMEEGSA